MRDPGQGMFHRAPRGKSRSAQAARGTRDTHSRGFTGDCGRAGETEMSQPRRCGAFFVGTVRLSALSPPNRGENPAGTSSRPAPSRGEIKPSSTTPDPLDGHTANPGVTTPVEPPPDNPGSIDPPKPPPPPPSPLSIAKEDIQKLLNAYREAYEAMDVNAIKRLYRRRPCQIFRMSSSNTSRWNTLCGPSGFHRCES